MAAAAVALLGALVAMPAGPAAAEYHESEPPPETVPDGNGENGDGTPGVSPGDEADVEAGVEAEMEAEVEADDEVVEEVDEEVVDAAPRLTG